MAITKTSTLQEIRILNASAESPVLLIQEEITVDDPNDAELPITTKTRRAINEQTENDDGTMSDTDVSGESQMIQDICGVIWPDDV